MKTYIVIYYIIMRISEFSKFLNHYNSNIMTMHDISKTLERLTYLEKEDDESYNFYKNMLNPIIYDDESVPYEDNYNIEEDMYGMHVEENCKPYFYNNQYDAWKNTYDAYLEEESERVSEEEEFDEDIYKLYLNALTNNVVE